MTALPAAPGSLSERILFEVRARILSGEWPPGHRIPFEHELTEAYSCSRMTVNKALTELAKAGLIERRRKLGSFVARPHSQSAMIEIKDVGAEVAALGLAYRFEVLMRTTRRATRADRARIEVSSDQSVLAVRCRHDAAEAPFCLEERLINLAAVPEAADEPFEARAPGPWLLARVPWSRAEHRIRAEAAGRETERTLGLAEGAPCLVIERRTWSGKAPVTQVRLTYPASHELVARFSPA